MTPISPAIGCHPCSLARSAATRDHATASPVELAEIELHAALLAAAGELVPKRVAELGEGGLVGH
jgi:hypothetical protein